MVSMGAPGPGRAQALELMLGTAKTHLLAPFSAGVEIPDGA